MGYCLQEHQNITPNGKSYVVNWPCVRSAEPKRNEAPIIILGDSVLNGGKYTDQSKLATSMLDRELKKIDPSVKVINASCGGWGVDNCYGFIEEFAGFIGARAVVLVLNSHDAVGKISAEEIAGTMEFPDRQYPLAWVQLFNQFILPRFGIYTKRNVEPTDTSEGNEFSEGWQKFYDYCTEKDIPLIIYLHAMKNEVEEFGVYNENGQRIITFAKEHDIPIITDLEYIRDEDYRDWIHLTEDGQHVIYDLLVEPLKKIISE